MLLTCISLVLDAGVIAATNSGAFPWFVAAQNGIISAMCTSLLINGFVGFQLYEDGTRLSVWLLRVTCFGTFVISFAVSLLTFMGWAGLGPTNTVGLFVVVYVINAICIAVYVIMQTILVVNTLQNRWPLGDLAFGIFFFVVGQVLLYVLGNRVCEGTSHYLDGLFFATVCNLLGVMMVYKVCNAVPIEGKYSNPLTNYSIGILLRKKISNSLSELNKVIGTSRTRCSNHPKTIHKSDIVSTMVMAVELHYTTLNLSTIDPSHSISLPLRGSD